MSFERTQIIFPAFSYYWVCGSLGLLDKDAAKTEVSLKDEHEQNRIIAYAHQQSAAPFTISTS